MSDMAETLPAPSRRLTRGRIAAGIIVAALSGLWIARHPIVEHFVDGALAQRGVPARYEIAKLGLGRQVLTNVSIGDPAAPDLIARRVVLTIELGVSGPYVKRVDAEGVRLRGALVGGRLRLGALDRLLPASNGSRFALPDLEVALQDVRMRLATPAGAVGLDVEGTGNLRDGFKGRVAATAHALTAGTCRIESPNAIVNVAVTRRQPALDGPVRAAAIVCGGMRATGAALAVDAMLGPALDRWDGTLLAELAGLSAPGGALGRTNGRIGFRGDAVRTTGAVQVTAIGARAAAAGRAGRIGIDGRYLLLARAGAGRFEGGVTLADGTIADARLAGVARALSEAGGTPLAPIGVALARAIMAAGRGVAGSAELAVQVQGNRGAVRIARADATSASGVRLGVSARNGIDYGWPGGALRIDGRAMLGGGGLPDTTLALTQARAGAPLTGTLAMAAIAAPGARLASAPVSFTSAGGATRFATRLTLDGPVADGRVTGLTLPIAGRLDPGGALAINEACVPLGFARLTLAGLTVGATRVPLCPSGRALIWRNAAGVFASDPYIPAPRLVGRLGSTPITLAARRLGLRAGQAAFTADELAVRLGVGDAISRLDIPQLVGRFGAAGIAGTFAGLSGQIARVPLILSAGAGDWRLAHAVLDLEGRLQVADDAAAPRFQPLVSDDVRLRLAGGRITAGGWLKEPAGGTRITQVAIRHDLRGGTGDAMLAVPGITFSPALQPEALTRLTLGVIANVRGTVSGAGQIAWGPDGVSSTGDFGTEAVDLAAAFGPVKGIATRIHFTDLLGLVSAPGQSATIAEVNPGIAVTGGRVRYRLLAGQQVAVERAHWPFSGGELELEPTILDFSEKATRRMSFRVRGVEAAQFVEQFDFKNVAVTGTFDGVVPIIFDDTGGRIEGGRLAVRQAGGTLAYVGEISNKDLGTFGSLAFDALKRMRYERLAIELDGSLDGEIVSRLLFDGTNETPKEAVQKNGLLSRFANLPFRFRITVRAPFRGLLNSARSLNDPRGLIDQALPKPVPPLPGSAPAIPIQSR